MNKSGAKVKTAKETASKISPHPRSKLDILSDPNLIANSCSAMRSDTFKSKCSFPPPPSPGHHPRKIDSVFEPIPGVVSNAGRLFMGNSDVESCFGAAALGFGFENDRKKGLAPKLSVNNFEGTPSGSASVAAPGNI